MRKIMVVVLFLFCLSGCTGSFVEAPTIKISPPRTEAFTGVTKPILRVRSYSWVGEHTSAYSSGTAFVIMRNKTLYLVTAYHVVSDSTVVEFLTHDNKPILVNISKVFLLSNMDAALMQIESISAKIEPLKLGVYKQGGKVKAIGYPKEGDYTEKEGHNYSTKVYTTAKLELGMSGGPVLDDEGNVIGINSAKVINDHTVKGIFSRLEDVFSRLDQVPSDK